MDYYNHFEKEYELDKKYKICGFSRGGLRTGFILKPHNIFLDAGVPSFLKPKLVLITHSHQDHIDQLYNHLLDTDEKPIVVANINLINFLQEYLNSCKSINAMKKLKFTNWNPRPIVKEIVLNICNTNYHIKAYNLDHEVETFGYGISESRSKLKEEYIELNQIEINKLKKNNIEITEKKLYPIIFFCGDMNYTSLDTLPFDEYPVFIIECTFLDLEHVKDAREKQHLHITDLIPHISKYQNTKFILIHFSCRYNKSVIKSYETLFDFKNVIFWI